MFQVLITIVLLVAGASVAVAGYSVVSLIETDQAAQVERGGGGVVDSGGG